MNTFVSIMVIIINELVESRNKICLSALRWSSVSHIILYDCQIVYVLYSGPFFKRFCRPVAVLSEGIILKEEMMSILWKERKLWLYIMWRLFLYYYEHYKACVQLFILDLNSVLSCTVFSFLTHGYDLCSVKSF